MQGFSSVSSIIPSKQNSCTFSTCNQEVDVPNDIDALPASCSVFLEIRDISITDLTDIEQQGCFGLGRNVDCVALSPEDPFFQKVYFRDTVQGIEDSQTLSTPQGPSQGVVIAVGCVVSVIWAGLIFYTIWSYRQEQKPKEKKRQRQMSHATQLTDDDKPSKRKTEVQSPLFREDAHVKYKAHLHKNLG